DLLTLYRGFFIPAAFLLAPQEPGFASRPGPRRGAWITCRKGFAGHVDVARRAIETGGHVIGAVDWHLDRIGVDVAGPQGAFTGVEEAPDLVLVVGFNGGGGLLLTCQPDVAAPCDGVIDRITTGADVGQCRVQYVLAVT